MPIHNSGLARIFTQTLGARATSSGSGNIDYLAVGNNPGQKLEDAEELGIKILDEKEFLKLQPSLKP